MNISEWKVSIQTGLYGAGRTEDGTPFTAESYYVQVENDKGR